jgi:predicted alpha/beta-fold hydrolase
MGLRFYRAGLRVIRVDLRGTGAGLTRARKPYHAGRSDDIRAVVVDSRLRHPESPVWVIGCSLGGNIALKLAGEAADVPLPGLAGVAALAPPIDIEACSRLLHTRVNRFYDHYFARRMLGLARRRARHFPEPCLDRVPRRPTIRQFDDHYTAPVCGFACATEYYRRSSAGPLVPKITVPTFVLTARDDPFIAIEPFEALPRSETLTVEISDRGGHLGFLGSAADGGIRWAEQRICDWLMRQRLTTVSSPPPASA